MHDLPVKCHMERSDNIMRDDSIVGCTGDRRWHLQKRQHGNRREPTLHESPSFCETPLDQASFAGRPSGSPAPGLASGAKERCSLSLHNSPDFRPATSATRFAGAVIYAMMALKTA